MSNKFNALLAFSMVFITSMTAGAWSQKGHDTTAAIAEKHLTETTRNAVIELLDGKSPVYWANWLDNASHTPEYAYTKTWHYKNIDKGVKYSEAPLLDSGDIVRALDEQIAILDNPASSREKRQLALKIVIHLLGDIHQPMHTGHATDRGGNSWKVKLFKRDTNLHSVWDNLPDNCHKWSYSEWVEQIDRPTQEEIQDILVGDPNTWCEETYKIGRKVYEQTPENYSVNYDYFIKWAPTVEQQFLRGGLRLADILNTVFDPEYTQKTRAVKR